ncbi:MAG: IMP dehydrogenase [Symbiopectobacterium sp.]
MRYCPCCIAKEALTFDDVLLNSSPAHPTALPSTADSHHPVYKNDSFEYSYALSAATDIVTESGLVIKLAQEGGIDFIHKNMLIER